MSGFFEKQGSRNFVEEFEDFYQHGGASRLPDDVEELIDWFVTEVRDHLDQTWAIERQTGYDFDPKKLERLWTQLHKRFIDLESNDPTVALHNAPRVWSELARRLDQGPVRQYISEVRTVAKGWRTPLRAYAELLQLDSADAGHSYELEVCVAVQGGVGVGAELSGQVRLLRVRYTNDVSGLSWERLLLMGSAGVSLEFDSPADFNIEVLGSGVSGPMRTYYPPSFFDDGMVGGMGAEVHAPGAVIVDGDRVVNTAGVGQLELYSGGRSLRFDMTGTSLKIGTDVLSPGSVSVELGAWTALGGPAYLSGFGPVQHRPLSPRGPRWLPMMRGMLHFATGSSRLGKNDHETLALLVKRIELRLASNYESVRIRITGCHSMLGAQQYNLELATARAVVARDGVDPLMQGIADSLTSRSRTDPELYQLTVAHPRDFHPEARFDPDDNTPGDRVSELLVCFFTSLY